MIAMAYIDRIDAAHARRAQLVHDNIALRSAPGRPRSYRFSPKGIMAARAWLAGGQL